MAKKCKCPPAGAPLWVMTYGDMMSLLLVFFIMLTAISEIPSDGVDPIKTDQVKEGFGVHSGGGRLPVDQIPTFSMLQRLEQNQSQRSRHQERSHTQDPGMDGPEADVTRIREGKRFVVGGVVMFEPQSADLTDGAQRQLRALARRARLRGKNNILEVRGHAASGELGGDKSRFADLWSLSYARARSVMRFLTRDGVGLRRERFRLVADADRAPRTPRAYTVEEQAPNRRVEIFQTEVLVQQFNHAEASEG